MAVTEQLNIRLAPGEKKQVAEAARRSDSTVSNYVRQRLFGRTSSDADDEALLELLADLKPRVKSAMATIDGNLAEIRRLRVAATHRDDTAVADRARKELSPEELGAVASRLQLKPRRPPVAGSRATRR